MNKKGKQTPSITEKTRIFLLDDHPVVRQGISEMIQHETDFVVCGEADNYQDALDGVTKGKPHVILVDISLSGSSGFEFLKALQMHQPGVKALVLSMHDETLYAERALREGARGYIMKQEVPKKIIFAIRHVLKGQIYLSETMMERVLEKKYGGISVDASPIEVLSDRELEVFRMIGEGTATSSIAKQLHRSVKTIETYRARIKVKLNLKNNMELIRLAMNWVQNE
ncbi:MAG: response regulator transcription factor [Candidatus Omnitrophota bacterium]|nr:response regulator transcription factor [Candidatus Omnitrophota bacterium]